VAKGSSLYRLMSNFGKCERHEKKSGKDIKQSDATQFRLGIQVRTSVSGTV